MRIGYRLLALALLALAAGCTTTPPTVGERVFLADLECLPDDGFQCGPASLTAVLRYHDMAAEADAVRAAIYSEGARGVIVQDMLWYAREEGLDARAAAATVADLRAEIDRGRPVIVQVDVGRFGQRINHFMVIAGYTDTQLIIHSGDQREEPIAVDRFARMWRATGQIAIFIGPRS